MNDLIFRKGNENDLKNMCKLWNEEYDDNHFLKPMTLEEFVNKINSYEDFNLDTTLVVEKAGEFVGYSIYYDNKSYYDNPNYGAVLSVLLVKKAYRNNGIGSMLVKKVEEYFKNRGKKEVHVKYYLPACFSWYIPNTDKHDHPCAPGIRVNSPEYLYFSHRGYDPFVFQDAFHANLSEYHLPQEIETILEKNAENGITIEVYDSKKHYGIEEFYEKLNIDAFNIVIKSNLELEKPYPFLVVAKDNKIMGWTGAMWNEESGRGHFDGIAILEEVRGNGVGKALFASLANYNKMNGAKFMTFYTGLNNFARFIYKGAGFKIVQSFCFMKKVLK